MVMMSNISDDYFEIKLDPRRDVYRYCTIAAVLENAGQGILPFNAIVATSSSV